MTLWLPTINYAKTYRAVSERLMKAMPTEYTCVNGTYLGDGQLASFVYFTNIKFKDDASCDLWLTHSAKEAKESAKINSQILELLWEDRRASDRSERLRLYKVSSYAR
jgi:hypothetical protein